MATISPQTESQSGEDVVYFWETLTNGDDGDEVELPGFADRSVQVEGTFGAGGSINLEGSNKPAPAVDADWVILTDPQGNALTLTAAGLEAISEYTRWIRPHVTAGDGTTDLDVRVICKRSHG